MPTTSTARNFHLAVLAGIAAGEVRRVKIGNTTHIEWFKKDGHITKFGRVFTRRPTHTVSKLVESGFARVRPDGTVLLTAAGKRKLAR